MGARGGGEGGVGGVEGDVRLVGGRGPEVVALVVFAVGKGLGVRREGGCHLHVVGLAGVLVLPVEGVGAGLERIPFFPDDVPLPGIALAAGPTRFIIDHLGRGHGGLAVGGDGDEHGVVREIGRQLGVDGIAAREIEALANGQLGAVGGPIDLHGHTAGGRDRRDEVGLGHAAAVGRVGEGFPGNRAEVVDGVRDLLERVAPVRGAVDRADLEPLALGEPQVEHPADPRSGLGLLGAAVEHAINHLEKRVVLEGVEGGLRKADGHDVDGEAEFLVPHPEHAAVVGHDAFFTGVDVVGGARRAFERVEMEAGKHSRRDLRASRGLGKHRAKPGGGEGDIAPFGGGGGEGPESELFASERKKLRGRERLLGNARCGVAEGGTPPAHFVGIELDDVVSGVEVERLLEIAGVVLFSVGVPDPVAVDEELCAIATAHSESVGPGDIDAEPGTQGPSVVTRRAGRGHRRRVGKCEPGLDGAGLHREGRRVRDAGGQGRSLAALDVNTGHVRGGQSVKGELEA